MGKYVKKVYPEGTAIRSNGRPDPRKGKITTRQETFCKLVVEGIYSNAECARRAGFAAATANEYAYKLMNGEDFPHVLERIQELREERERKYGVSTIGSSNVCTICLAAPKRRDNTPAPSTRRKSAPLWVVLPSTGERTSTRWIR